MAQPIWVTAAGSLGTYSPSKYLHVTLFAKPPTVDSEVQYKLLNGTLPAGLTLDPSTGQIAGTPTTAGTYTFTVRATDANGVFKDVVVTIIVDKHQIINVSTVSFNPFKFICE